MKKEVNFMVYVQLFWAFFKIGLFTFGGGYAMIPLIHKEAEEKHGWVSDKDILDIIAIAESTPGVIAVNSATFIGYKVAGFWGSLLATLGVVLPSFIVISIISLFFLEFKQNIWVAKAFEGVRAAVVVLMTGAIVKLGKYISITAFYIILVLCAFVLSAIFNVSTIYILVGAGILGVLYTLFGAPSGKAGEK